MVEPELLSAIAIALEWPLYVRTNHMFISVITRWKYWVIGEVAKRPAKVAFEQY